VFAASSRLRVSEEVLDGVERAALYVCKSVLSPRAVLERGAGGVSRRHWRLCAAIACVGASVERAITVAVDPDRIRERKGCGSDLGQHAIELALAAHHDDQPAVALDGDLRLPGKPERGARERGGPVGLNQMSVEPGLGHRYVDPGGSAHADPQRNSANFRAGEAAGVCPAARRSRTAVRHLSRPARRQPQSARRDGAWSSFRPARRCAVADPLRAERCESELPRP
jgi:hypothetical protein